MRNCRKNERHMWYALYEGKSQCMMKTAIILVMTQLGILRQ